MAEPTADEIISFLSRVGTSSFSNNADKFRVESALLGALRRVQTPFDIALEHAWGHPITLAYIKTLIDAGFWQKWAAAGAKPATSAELASISGVDQPLLKRILRMLAGRQLVTESGDGDTYEATAFSKALAEPVFPAIYTFYYEFNQPCFGNFPKYAKKLAYVNPTDPVSNNTTDWLGGKDVFAFFGENPVAGESFNKAMTCYSASKTPWVDLYPTEELVSGAKTSAPILCDVAGGVGHDIEKFRAKHPDVPENSLVLQDLPHVVEKATVTAPVTKQEIDLLVGQPAQGARAYYLHTVLHDWPEEKAVEILKLIGKSMERGYSRILLHEAVIPPKDANPVVSLADGIMLCAFSALEREEWQWRKIVDEAGMKVVKIHAPEASESIIELELA